MAAEPCTQASLDEPGSYGRAIAGCDCVVHMASPLMFVKAGQVRGCFSQHVTRVHVERGPCRKEELHAGVRPQANMSCPPSALDGADWTDAVPV